MVAAIERKRGGEGEVRGCGGELRQIRGLADHAKDTFVENIEGVRVRRCGGELRPIRGLADHAKDTFVENIQGYFLPNQSRKTNNSNSI